MSHTYDEAKANEAMALIKNKYFPILNDLNLFLQKEMDKN